MVTQDQHAVLAFLTNPLSHGDAALNIHTTETHLSVIIFVGSRVFKLKRAVRLPYVDFSTPQRRLEACHRELALNRRTAPQLYVAVRQITREADGRLVFDGPGELFDAVVEMVRFDEDALFDRLAVRGQLTPIVLTELAGIIARFHAEAAIDRHGGGADRIAAVLTTNEESLTVSGIFLPATIATLTTNLWRAFDEHVALLNARAREGKVRRCHGDLHLRNICLVQGVPTLFDCVEFDEALGTVDVLYDLAFLLMDLWHLGLASDANLVFNRYLDERNEVDGLSLLPFFMAVRASIRAHVTAQLASQATGQQRDDLAAEAESYAALALRLLAPVSVRLVAIGGLSGTGKSTVAAAIAHTIGPAPGARVVASDRIRKRCYGVSAQTRLPAQAYHLAVSQRVYAALARNVRVVLSAGHGAVADAVYDRADERDRIERIALETGVPFTGIWLYAQPAQLFSRVDQRSGDPSDATAEVVREQLARDCGRLAWLQIDASSTVAAAAAHIAQVLAVPDT
ncbi:MAG: aminoglycoside phosphotransferase [Castellaniella sp.]|uniref:bifunctional aminoglycoside phosphotransferase/ATP-binding protein n=1 Tax=Castellaniella sp. TaxID=1955812 RepID=UPI0012176D6A|nr:bifunctional aminoglycoside phosphotransferase/ATP-binding protein [Castellaniella sp.]TAN30023.1 MAG: aminoglycoside phosphotransferase [Castellaniella sp.]